MTQGDGSAAGVHSLAVERQLVEAGQHLAGERLVQLDLVDLVVVESASAQQRLDGRHRADSHDPRIDADDLPVEQPGGGLDTEPLDGLLGQDE